MNVLYRNFRTKSYYFHIYRFKSRTVLGIETSCDETGAAVVDESGNILGEALRSQLNIHLENGGVIPHLAKYMHGQNIHEVVSSALNESGITLEDISGIAVTVKPGLKSSLQVGLDYAKQLVKNRTKPFIPVHHMEAHALTVRMVEKVQFPFLVLLASGGHCQIAVAKNVNEFLLLGTSLHNSPGEVMDKIARQLKLRNLPEYYNVSGGRAIELVAEGGNPLAYEFPRIMENYRDCDFSFSGFSSCALSTVKKEEIYYDVAPDGIIPNVKDFCASLQFGIARHLMHRIIRSMIYCERNKILPETQKTLVFSGGVACNNFMRDALKNLCVNMGYNFVCPQAKLCTDNGIMIAWNGIEKLKAEIGIAINPENVMTDANCPLGVDIRDDVRRASIKVKYPRFEMNDEEHKKEVVS